MPLPAPDASRRHWLGSLHLPRRSRFQGPLQCSPSTGGWYLPPATYSRQNRRANSPAAAMFFQLLHPPSLSPMLSPAQVSLYFALYVALMHDTHARLTARPWQTLRTANAAFRLQVGGCRTQGKGVLRAVPLARYQCRRLKRRSGADANTEHCTSLLQIRLGALLFVMVFAGMVAFWALESSCMHHALYYHGLMPLEVRSSMAMHGHTHTRMHARMPPCRHRVHVHWPGGQLTPLPPAHPPCSWCGRPAASWAASCSCPTTPGRSSRRWLQRCRPLHGLSSPCLRSCR